MNPNEGQGGGPNDPAQRHDHPSSSSPRLAALPLLTPSPELQPQGGYPRSFNVGNPIDGNIARNVFAPLVVPMPGPSYVYTEVAGPSVPNANASASQNQYQPWANQPQPDSAVVFPASGYNPAHLPEAGVYAQQPSSATVFNAPGHNSNDQPGAPLYAQPSAATDFSAWGGNTNDDPYTSAGMVAPPAAANQGASGDPDGSRLALQNFLADELLDAVQRARTPGDLEAIVNTVMRHQYNGDRVSLMEVAETSAGEIALMELVSRLAALNSHPEVLQRLFRCLVHGWRTEQSNGPDLLRHFFTTLGHVHCSIFIDELAVPHFWEMVTSRLAFGHESMMTCLDNAGHTEQGAALIVTFLNLIVEIARNIYGFQFLRRIIQVGHNVQLQERIRERVEANLVVLSMDQCGNNVVQVCFVSGNRMSARSERLLQRGLGAFLRLPDDEQLRQLVQNGCARCVLRRLIDTSVHHNVAVAEAMELAVRILGVGEGWRGRGDPRLQALAILQ